MSPIAHVPDDLDRFSPACEPAVDASMVPFRRLALAVFDRAREDRDIAIPSKEQRPKLHRPRGRRQEEPWSFKRRLQGWVLRQRRYDARWADRESRQEEAGAFILNRDSLWHDLLADVLPGRKNGRTSGNGRQH
ncbi:hypothetical protein LCGC14_0723290 [marine sediment metagenome]|uniref:Uncharacterized protein n=1 Tax=marine sediment metagenome TaxID=412755 RepID=A0A0F9TJ32_9ZZZZ